jgi:hypothetical protein
MPLVTSIYYAGIGVSTRLSIKDSDYFTSQVIEKWNYGLEHYAKSKRDVMYGNFEISRAEFYLKPTWAKFFKIVYYYFQGQLPGCHNSIKLTIALFSHLVGFKISSYRK